MVKLAIYQPQSIEGVGARESKRLDANMEMQRSARDRKSSPLGNLFKKMKRTAAVGLVTFATLASMPNVYASAHGPLGRIPMAYPMGISLTAPNPIAANGIIGYADISKLNAVEVAGGIAPYIKTRSDLISIQLNADVSYQSGGKSRFVFAQDVLTIPESPDGAFIYPLASVFADSETPITINAVAGPQATAVIGRYGRYYDAFGVFSSYQHRPFKALFIITANANKEGYPVISFGYEQSQRTTPVFFANYTINQKIDKGTQVSIPIRSLAGLKNNPPSYYVPGSPEFVFCGSSGGSTAVFKAADASIGVFPMVRINGKMVAMSMPNFDNRGVLTVETAANLHVEYNSKSGLADVGVNPGGVDQQNTEYTTTGAKPPASVTAFADLLNATRRDR